MRTYTHNGRTYVLKAGNLYECREDGTEVRIPSREANQIIGIGILADRYARTGGREQS